MADSKAVHDRKRAQAWQGMGKLTKKDWEVLARTFGFASAEECQEFAVIQEANRVSE